jgi:hypothetical protein
MPTLNITITAQQANRMAAGVGSILNLGRNATAQEIGQYLWALGKSQVMNQETNDALKAVPAPTDLGDST